MWSLHLVSKVTGFMSLGMAWLHSIREWNKAKTHHLLTRCGDVPLKKRGIKRKSLLSILGSECSAQSRSMWTTIYKSSFSVGWSCDLLISIWHKPLCQTFTTQRPESPTRCGDYYGLFTLDCLYELPAPSLKKIIIMESRWKVDRKWHLGRAVSFQSNRRWNSGASTYDVHVLGGHCNGQMLELDQRLGKTGTTTGSDVKMCLGTRSQRHNVKPYHGGNIIGLLPSCDMAW